MINANDPLLPVPDNSNLHHVLVVLNKEATAIKKNVRCIYCGLIVMQHHQAVELVYLGKVIEERLGYEVRCDRCKTIHVFL